MILKKLVWQLFFAFLIITTISISCVTIYFTGLFRQPLYNWVQSGLYSRAKLLEDQFTELTAQNNFSKADLLCKKLGPNAKTRITVILPSGKVIGDSEKDISEMDNHSDRPEIVRAKKGNILPYKRYSYTLRENMMYVAIPLYHNNRLTAFLRTSLSVHSIENSIFMVYIKIIVAGLIILLICGILSWYIAKRITIPINEIKQWSESIATGDFNLSPPVKFKYSEEINSLSGSMYRMSEELNNRFNTMTRQKNEIQAILSSMVEGVFAVDMEERIISLNNAACKLMNVNPESAKGKLIQEIIRNADLQKFVRKVISSNTPVESDIVFHNGIDRFLQANGTALIDSQKNYIGALIVLNDVTRIKKLENMRREFVANVSHELKTPITSIKGFVETLMEGAIKDPVDSQNFLQIISKQTNRLMAIIEDLLSLSKIEQDEETHSIYLEKNNIKDPIKDAIEICTPRAESKNIKLYLISKEDIYADINPPLLEQAMVNLIDNAIKYSNPESQVNIEVISADTEIIVSVRDWGCGIETKHLSRLFERFYRVDKDRNRKLGGTGLGLAIVKHIVHAHNGFVNVESSISKGSTFFIHLPK